MKIFYFIFSVFFLYPIYVMATGTYREYKIIDNHEVVVGVVKSEYTKYLGSNRVRFKYSYEYLGRNYESHSEKIGIGNRISESILVDGNPYVKVFVYRNHPSYSKLRKPKHDWGELIFSIFLTGLFIFCEIVFILGFVSEFYPQFNFINRFIRIHT